MITLVCLLLLPNLPTDDAATQPIQFALLPGQYDLSSWVGAVTTNASDAQQCLDIAWYSDNTTLAFSFKNATGECKYASTINGFKPYHTSGPPDYYLRCDNIIRDNSTCLTNQDAEYLIMKHTYGGLNCPRSDITQQGTQWCVDVAGSAPDFGVYKSGYYTNGTNLLLTKDLVNTSVSWQCNSGYFWKMIFNDQWYCFLTYGIGSGDGRYSMIADNYCDTQTSGSSSVVVNDPRLFLWLYKYYPWSPMYIGLILNNSTNTFQWYDGSSHSFTWASGCPNNDTGNKTLAIIDSSGNVCDEDPLQMSGLTCWFPATSQPYDHNARFW